ncbi:hypothetical protein ERIN107935_00555 [Erysipelothrix inopinata]
MKDWKSYIVIVIFVAVFTIIYSQVVPLYMTEKQYLISSATLVVGSLIVIRIITKKNK